MENNVVERLERLKKLREPFPAHQISKLPKPTIGFDEYKKLPKAKCSECGGYHPTTNTIHLDYVGHAALTARLLDVDPEWTWKPLSYGEDGLPRFDDEGGLWIILTVCGVSRFGYGNAKNNQWADIGARIKEVIGDALRNAAMRFGCALELWHKGDLYLDDEHEDTPEAKTKTETTATIIFKEMLSINNLAQLNTYWNKNKARIDDLSASERQAVVKTVTSIKKKLPK
jgi:hypothetical protein